MTEKFPLVVMGDDTVVYAGLTTKKSAEKTLETGELWVVHPDTGKTVPACPPCAVSTVRRVKSPAGVWYVAQSAREQKMNESSSVSHTARNDDAQPAADKISKNSIGWLQQLYEQVADRKKNPMEGSYTAHLFAAGTDKIRKKMGEESVEVILSRSSDELKNEVADLLYHVIVLLVDRDVSFESCLDILRERHKADSGI